MIAGIDVSTKQIAVVLLDDDTDEARSYTVELGPDLWEACKYMWENFPPLKLRGTWLVGIEDPMGRHNMGTAKKLGMVTGAVLSSLPLAVTVLPMPPTEWKRETCGVPMAKKDEVAAWVGRTWTNIPALVTQDELDAYAIAYAARAVNARAVEAAG